MELNLAGLWWCSRVVLLIAGLPWWNCDLRVEDSHG
jgi:hypothetical protein